MPVDGRTCVVIYSSCNTIIWKSSRFTHLIGREPKHGVLYKPAAGCWLLAEAVPFIQFSLFMSHVTLFPPSLPQDIVDTGATMQKLLSLLATYKPANVRVARYVHSFVWVTQYTVSCYHGNTASVLQLAGEENTQECWLQTRL